MKKYLMPVLAAGMSLQALPTYASNSDAMPVVMGSSCREQLIQPDESAGHIFSGDCKIAYVLPNKQGKTEIVDFMPTAHLALCGGVDTYAELKTKANRILIQLIDRQAEAKTEAERAKLQTQIDQLKKNVETGGAYLRNKDAAYAHLVFTNGVEQKDLNKWIVANIELVRTQGLSFKAALISSSVLTFAAPLAERLGEEAILRSDIPNLQKKSDDRTISVVFNGSASGQVVFNVFGACGLLDKAPKTLEDVQKAKLKKDDLGAALVTNQTYEVPTRSRMWYKAVLKKMDAVNFLNHYAKTRGQDFTISEFVNRAGEAEVKDLVTLEVGTDSMSPSQFDNWNEFQKIFISDVTERLATRMFNEIEALGVLKLEKRSPEDAPAPGTIYVDGTQTTCSTQRIFGIRVGGGCSTQWVKIPKIVDGRSTLVDVQKLNVNIEISETMTIEQPHSYLFTAGFKTVGK